MSKQRTIAVVTGSRAEFGLFTPVMRAIVAQPSLQLATVVTGAHLITAVYSGDVDDATSTSPAVNQIVIAVGEPPGPAEAIPTMSEWMLLVTMALVALAALRRLRRLE